MELRALCCRIENDEIRDDNDDNDDDDCEKKNDLMIK
jgi:hypothetical protein